LRARRGKFGGKGKSQATSAIDHKKNGKGGTILRGRKPVHASDMGKSEG